MTCSPEDLHHLLGNIDIYLFDQILKGRVNNLKTALDAGCGHGRNLDYFLHNDFEVFGVDEDENAIRLAQQKASRLAPRLPLTNFRIAQLSDLPFATESFDLVICNAVLHFAANHRHFDEMFAEIWRVLQRGGLFFCRLASKIGMESQVKQLSKGRYLLPDGSTRYLVDEQRLLEITQRMQAELLDPIKTTIVQNQRCMTTWCMRKGDIGAQ